MTTDVARKPAGRLAGRRQRHNPGRRRGAIAGPSLVGGIGMALSLPPWGFWVLGPLGAGVVWWRLGGLPARSRMLAGWAAGIGLFGPGLFWALSFNLAGGVVLILLESSAIGLAAWAAPGGQGRMLALPGSMVLAEALRDTWPLGGLPLGSVALGQADGPLLAADRIGGPLLVVGLVWLLGAGGGTFAVSAGHRIRRVGPHQVVSAAVAGLAVVGCVAATLVAGHLAPDGGRAVRTIRVAAVQGGGARGLRKGQVDPTVVYQAQQAATAAIAAHDGGRPPSLVVWPEDVVSIGTPLGWDPKVESALGSTAASLDATLTVGLTETVSSTAFRNEIVAFAPDGSLVSRVEKVHRVPFGEYVPWRGVLRHLVSLSAVPLDAIPGHSNEVLHTPAGPLATLISYEVFFADRGRGATRAGAQLLLVPTNTSSYATSQVPTQEIAASRLQAVAEGRDLVQAAPTGYSAFVGHDGRVRARSVLGHRQVIVRDVGLRTGATIYARFGDWPVLAAGTLLLVAGRLAGRLRHRLKRRQS